MKRTVVVIAAIVIMLAAAFAIERSVWLFNDNNSADGLVLREALSRAAGERRINVIAVNGGNWRALCVVGAGESPSEVLRTFGRANRIRVSTIQRIRSWLYVGYVPQGSLALVLVTDRGSVRSRRTGNISADHAPRRACALRADEGLVWK